MAVPRMGATKRKKQSRPTMKHVVDRDARTNSRSRDANASKIARSTK
jgi:hypothetical protein